MTALRSRVVLALAAPVLALLFSVLVTSVVLLVVGDNPISVFSLMGEYGTRPRTLTLTINAAITYYLSALAVAIGFRMDLFNIGVDGQYRLAAMLAAAVGGAIALPAPLHVLTIVVVAMLVGGFWAGIAGVLKVTRGVSEVISTIMLNFIATAIVAYLLTTDRLAVQVEGSNNIGTEPIPPSGQMPGIPLIPGSSAPVFGFLIVAILAGVAFWFLLGRTRFGFDLKATGMSESAAVASGVSVRRMIVLTMFISGALAGLVGMPQLLGASYQYSLDFPTRSRVHRHRDRAARPQQSHRDRFRCAALGIPRPVGADPRPRGCPQGDRHHHAGDDRAVRRGGVRAGAALPAAPAAAHRWTRGRSRAGAGGGGGMSNVSFETPISPELREQSGRRLSAARLALYAALGLVLLSVIRLLTGADDITSAGLTGAALGLAVPIGLAGLGGLWSERAGVVNIGLEGMLILGTWGAGWAGYQYGPWAGVVCGVIFGALGGLLHAVATVTFGVDHIVSGVAINILAFGITQYLSAIVFEGVEGGGPTQSPQIGSLGDFTVPGLASVLGSLEDLEWFLVSDVAGVLRGLTYQVSWLTLIAVLLVPLTWFVLWRTAFGLRLRSCGEAPYAAETLGVNVYLYKYVAVVMSGGLAGLGGAFLAIVSAGIYREGQTGGRGYIGLAAMIFGNWRPGGTAAGAALFGYTDALQLRQGSTVHALLLLVVIVLTAVAVLSFVRRRPRPAVISLIAAIVVLGWFLSTDSVPSQLTFATPYITTLLVLSLASQRLRPPAADGIPYRRGEDG